MNRFPCLQFAAAVLCAVAAGCASVAASAPAGTDVTDLGAGLTMTADGAVRGGLPAGPSPSNKELEDSYNPQR